MHQLEGRPSGRPSFFCGCDVDVTIYCVIATINVTIALAL
jgi:hypothetical protein